MSRHTGRPSWFPPPPSRPRGAAKLEAALSTFRVPVSGRIAADIGACAGGFTTALLEAGARRVYAVDAGHGQLLGSLRLDPRVVNLERTNIALLDRALIPDRIDAITVDLSYLSIARALPQLDDLDIAPDADLVALVKPMFELGLGAPPADRDQAASAVALARAGAERCGWEVRETMESPVRGTRGSVEFLIHARRVPR